MKELNGDKIKRAVSGIKLSDAAKSRIIHECEAAREPKKQITAFSLKRVLAAAAVVVLTVALAVGTVAVVGKIKDRGFKAPVENVSHFSTDPDLSDVQDDCTIVSADGAYRFKCNSVTGGEDKVYIDCTLTRKDGGIVADGLPSDGEELPLVRVTGSLRLSDGSRRQAWFFQMSDSTETEYHLEGQVLMTRRLPEEVENAAMNGEKPDYDDAGGEFFSAEEMKKLLEGSALFIDSITAEAKETKTCELSPGLPDALSSREAGDAAPKFEDRYVYDSDGNAYRMDQVECTLEAGGMDVPFSADGSVTVDNYGFGPYHHQHADLSDLTALYLNLKGYDIEPGEHVFVCADGTLTSFYAAVTGYPAPGIVTVAVYDSHIEDMTLERLSEAASLRSVIRNSGAVAEFASGLTLSGDFKNVKVDRDFAPVTIELENGQVVLRKSHLTNTSISLYGICTAEGALDLHLDEAYVVTTDGEEIALGSKCGAGTLNGEFSITWQNKTVIDPEKISEIHVAGVVIPIDHDN